MRRLEAGAVWINGVASGCRNFHPYDGRGFSSIAFDLKNSTESGEKTRADIVHVASAGRKMKWGAMILNVNDAQTFNIVAAADCQQIQGSAIAPPQQYPRRMTHLPREAISGGAVEAGCEEWF